jgi:hypothetical protein
MFVNLKNKYQNNLRLKRASSKYHELEGEITSALTLEKYVPWGVSLIVALHFEIQCWEQNGQHDPLLRRQRLENASRVTYLQWVDIVFNMM